MTDYWEIKSLPNGGWEVVIAGETITYDPNCKPTIITEKVVEDEPVKPIKKSNSEILKDICGD